MKTQTSESRQWVPNEIVTQKTGSIKETHLKKPGPEKKKPGHFKKAGPSLKGLEGVTLPKKPIVDLAKFADKTLAADAGKGTEPKEEPAITYTTKVKEVREAYHFVKEVYKDIDTILKEESGHGISDHGADLIEWTVKTHDKLTDKGADLIEATVRLHDKLTDKGADLIEGAVDFFKGEE